MRRAGVLALVTAAVLTVIAMGLVVLVVGAFMLHAAPTPTPTRAPAPTPVPRVLLDLPSAIGVSGVTLGCPQPVGDVTGDGSVNALDALYLVNHVFSGGPAPARARCTVATHVEMELAGLRPPFRLVVCGTAAPCTVIPFAVPGPSPVPPMQRSAPVPKSLLASMRSSR